MVAWTVLFLAEFRALFYYKCLPLFEQTLVDISEKVGHEGVFIGGRIDLIVALFKLLHSWEMLCQNNWSDQICGLAKQKFVFVVCPGGGRFLKEPLHEMSEFLEKLILLGVDCLSDSIGIKHLKLDPN